LDDGENSGPENPNFENLDYGNNVYTRRHVLVFNYIYALPFGKGKAWLRNAGKVENALVGGWQVSVDQTFS
jgi:hypothetical protein